MSGLTGRHRMAACHLVVGDWAVDLSAPNPCTPWNNKLHPIDRERTHIREVTEHETLKHEAHVPVRSLKQCFGSMICGPSMSY